MNEVEFEQLVKEAIDALPEAGKKSMRNVVFLIEKEVRSVKANEMGIKKGQTLLGLYEGVSKLNRGTGYTWVLPDKITIFQNPIETIAGGDPKRIKEMVFDVVIHEVGHHLGFNEAEIRDHEARRKKNK